MNIEKTVQKYISKQALGEMVADLNDIAEGTDEEVLDELNEMGVDMEKAREKLKKIMKIGRGEC